MSMEHKSGACSVSIECVVWRVSISVELDSRNANICSLYCGKRIEYIDVNQVTKNIFSKKWKYLPGMLHIGQLSHYKVGL